MITIEPRFQRKFCEQFIQILQIKQHKYKQIFNMFYFICLYIFLFWLKHISFETKLHLYCVQILWNIIEIYIGPFNEPLTISYNSCIKKSISQILHTLTFFFIFTTFNQTSHLTHYIHSIPQKPHTIILSD